MSVLIPALKGDFKLKECGPLELIRRGFKQHGDIFRIKILHQSFTFLVGSDASTVFFKANDRELSQKEVYGFTVPVFGKGIVYDAPLKIMNQQLKFVKHGVTQDMLQSYVAKVVDEAEMYLHNLAKSGEVFDWVHAMSELTMFTASRCLLGQEVRHDLHEEFADYYEQLNHGMVHLGVFWPYAPIPAHKTRDKARENIAKLFRRVIQARRASGVKHNDMLQLFMDSKYLDGTQASDDEIVGLLLATLFAGQHTSNITSSWACPFIYNKGKEFLGRLEAEQEKVLTGTNGELNFSALSQMDLLYWCMKETLRMCPPLILLMRYVQVPRVYKGYTIPKGEVVITSPAVNHRLDTWTNPDVFDPDRFSPERHEDKVPYSWIPFGSGRHSCLGENFAMVQLKTIFSVLIRKYDVELLDPIPPVDYSSLVVGPKGQLRARITKKETPIGPLPEIIGA